MMKDHLAANACRTAILSALLLGQGQAVLFAQQSAQPVTNESNITTAPSQTRSQGVGQDRDQDLKREIQQQFAADAAFQSIAVSVSNGVVVLGGPVASKRDKRRAVNSVKALSGAYRIDDHLTISPGRSKVLAPV